MAILYEVQDAPGEGFRECYFVFVIIYHNSLINDRVLIFHLSVITILSIHGFFLIELH